MVQSERAAAEVDHLHGPAGAPPHAQPAEQGVHAAHHPGPARHRRRADRPVPVRGRPGTTSTWFRTSPALPGRGDHPDGRCPAEYRQQVRHWIDTSLHREPGGRLGVSEAGMRANIETAIYYYNLVQERARRAAGRHDQQAHRRGRSPMTTGTCASWMTSRSADSQRFGRGRRRDGHQVAGHRGGELRPVPRPVAEAARRSDQDPGRGRGDAALRGPGAVQRALHPQRGTAARPVDPRGKPVFLIGAAANRDPRAFTDADKFDIDRDRTEAQNLGWAAESTVASARRSPGWRAPSRWNGC